MKLNKKERVYELIESYSMEMKHDEYPKFTTNFLSEKMDMQRTNLSSILNQLVKEGKLLKHNGRPVLYQYMDPIGDGNDVFSGLVGYDGSLKEAVSTAKAAILYPEGKPNILLTAAKGCGVKYFAQIVFRFAVKAGVVKASATMLQFDCKAYKENEEYRRSVLFGTKEQDGLLQKSRNGMLLIKNIELLPGYERRQILKAEERGIIICCVTPDIKEETMDFLKENVDFTIHIPGLKERRLKERFQLIQKFFQEEAKNLKRNLEVDSSVLYALLLYDVVENTKGLKNDIHAGCAGCYARAHKSRRNFIEVLMSDFPNFIRKGIIYYKVHKAEIDELISGDFIYAFTDSNMLKKLKGKKEEKSMTIYQSLDSRKKRLKGQKITEAEVDTLVSVKLQTDFGSYYQDLCDKMKSMEQLQNLVSEKLIRLVESFLEKAGEFLHEKFDEKMLGAICFHLNGCFVRVDSKQRIPNEEIKQIIHAYPAEYELARDFIKVVEHEFFISLNIDEIIYTILFLIQNRKTGRQKVATLIAMHGNGGASSIADVANAMTGEHLAFAYDLPLDKNMRDAYDELKQVMMRIHQGKGILLIYDMGSIRTMAEAIAAETGIEVSYFEIPITLLAYAGSKKAGEDESLSDISSYLHQNMKNMEYIREDRNNSLTLEQLLPKTADTTREAAKMLPGTGNENKDPILDDMDESAIIETYEYLKETFENLDMDRMELLLDTFIQQMEYLFDTSLNSDKKIGMIIHIVCLIDRIQNHYTPAINFIASDIITEHKELVLEVKKILGPLEKEFGVYINDGEIATIISIIR